MATAENKRPRSSGGGVERPLSRKEILGTKKAIKELIRKAVAVKDHLARFPDFHKYERSGNVPFGISDSRHLLSFLYSALEIQCFSIYLESGHGNQLPANMEGTYGSEWPSEEKIKRREMVAPEARYILTCQYTDNDIAKCFMKQDSGVECAHVTCRGGRLLGFVHYRFIVEEDVPVLYVYELQLESSAQGKGLRKFLMQLIELIACKSQMWAVMLTVQKSNTDAMVSTTIWGKVICNIQYLAITSGSTGITLPRKIVSTRTRYSYVDSFISHRLEFIEAMRSCARHLNLKPSANWRPMMYERVE
ncbi:N-alpha-acetyltransferase 40, NatD catalytic subunit [Triticum urartu]|uniref:N-alpha-acetyltransferase 40 n=1 Tax=Triticum urartu TaxID=4572 RepID=M7ZII1_TRIUA|nr:N-alpha-acetyltransferase 40, NatD catalytic subunit [Triticum urartu]